MAKESKLLREIHAGGEHRGFLVWCPGCEQYHGINIVDDGKSPVWKFDGNMESPTFTPSLLIYEPLPDGKRKTRCHSFIRKGKWEFLPDSLHKLAGQTVDMVSEPPY